MKPVKYYNNIVSTTPSFDVLRIHKEQSIYAREYLRVGDRFHFRVTISPLYNRTDIGLVNETRNIDTKTIRPKDVERLFKDIIDAVEVDPDK